MTQSDGELLRLQFEKLKARKKTSQAEFAREFKVPGGASMISQHISGNRPIGLDAAVAYMQGFGCTLAEISPALAVQMGKLDQSGFDFESWIDKQQEFKSTKPHPLGGNWSHSVLTQAPLNPAIDLDNNPEYPAIRRVNIKAQAGVSGYAVEHMGDDGPPIVFRADWYKGKGYKPDKMLALRVTGESMIPSLYEGDLIVINTEQTQPKQGLPFLVSYEGEVVVKRMVRDDGLWWLTSDNPDQRRYPRTKCNGETQIIGEVVYRQTERI